MTVAIDTETLKVDYGWLEPRIALQTIQAMKSGRVSGKSIDFDNVRSMLHMYGMGREEYEKSHKPCKRCGSRLAKWDVHDRRTCSYQVSFARYAQLGMVPVVGAIRKVLKHSLKCHWGTQKRSAESVSTQRPLQKGYYAPVWAVILHDNSDIGSRTASHKTKVRELTKKLRSALADPAEQCAIAGEYLLTRGNGGLYSRACKALIARVGCEHEDE